MTRLLSASSPDDLAEAVRLLRDGQPVALPTETVYGLAADALRPDALLKIFQAKERPLFDPLIVHLPDPALWLPRLTPGHFPGQALAARLAAAFWPGPLTLVLPRRDPESVPDLVTSGLGTVALRVSAHPVFHAIVTAFGRPLAAPSANRFGRISPTTAAAALAELHGRIPAVLDGGPAAHGLESTIVQPLDDHTLRILRPGPVTPAALARFATIIATSVNPASSPAPAAAPGQLPSHYAPRAPLVLSAAPSDHPLPPGVRAALLAWRAPAPQGKFTLTRILSPSGDLPEAARNLFAALRELDDAAPDLIVAENIPETGIGHAIMDRLRRAAAPRPRP